MTRGQHRRALHKIAPGHWEASCLCGWSATRPSRLSASVTYTVHLQLAIQAEGNPCA